MASPPPTASPQLTGKLDDELRYVDRLRAVTRDADPGRGATSTCRVTDYACIAFVPGKK